MDDCNDNGRACGAAPLVIPRKVIASLGRVVDILYEGQSSSYLATPQAERPGHLFHDVRRLNLWRVEIEPLAQASPDGVPAGTPRR